MTLSAELLTPGGANWTGFTEALEREGLPTDDLGDAGQRFYAFTLGGQAVAFGGLQDLGEDVLLRSLVVDATRKRQGFGAAAVRVLVGLAVEAGTRRIWLLTTGAADFFARQGFTRAERAAAPEAIANARQFTSLCPSTAVLMCLTPA